MLCCGNRPTGDHEGKGEDQPAHGRAKSNMIPARIVLPSLWMPTARRQRPIGGTSEAPPGTMFSSAELVKHLLLRGNALLPKQMLLSQPVRKGASGLYRLVARRVSASPNFRDHAILPRTALPYLNVAADLIRLGRRLLPQAPRPIGVGHLFTEKPRTRISRFRCQRRAPGLLAPAWSFRPALAAKP